MIKLFPGRAKKLANNSFNNYLGKFDRLLRNGLEAQAFWSGNHALQRDLFAHYWAQEADTVEYNWDDRFKQDFLGRNVIIIDALEDVLKEITFDRLYEIGCGHGQVLDYLADRLEAIDEFVGIDISEEQIRKNKEKFSQPKIEFHAADAVKWVIDNAKPRSIFLTNGGVFEYFLQSELEAIFKHIAEKLAPAVIGVVETLGSDHDLENELKTMIYGRELAFSHNYPHLLQKAGLEVIHHSEEEGAKTHGGGRWIRVLAVKHN